MERVEPRKLTRIRGIALGALIAASCGGSARTVVYVASVGSRLDSVAEFDEATGTVSHRRPVTVPEGFWPEPVGEGLWAWAATDYESRYSAVHTARLSSEGEVTPLAEVAVSQFIRTSVVIPGLIGLLRGGLGRETGYIFEVYSVDSRGVPSQIYRDLIPTGPFGGSAWLARHPLGQGFIVSAREVLYSYEATAEGVKKIGQIPSRGSGVMAVDATRRALYINYRREMDSILFDATNPLGRPGPRMTLASNEIIEDGFLAETLNGEARLFLTLTSSSSKRDRVVVIAPGETGFVHLQEIPLTTDLYSGRCMLSPRRNHLIVQMSQPPYSLAEVFTLRGGGLDPVSRVVLGRLGPFVDFNQNKRAPAPRT